MKFFKSARRSNPISGYIQCINKMDYVTNNAFTHMAHNVFANPKNMICITNPEIYDIEINL